MTKKLLMGNEAMAHAALEAGVAVVAGYPGTPSSEVVETVARQHARGAAHGVHVEWSTNEKAALELLFGASLVGKRCLFSCKQMGLNVASDALMSLNYVSVRGGLVLVVADDPGPISSQTEQDTRRFASFAKVPVLDPASPEQAFEMVKAAFDVSERFHTPVIVRPTTRVDHASTFIDVADETAARVVLDSAAVPEVGSAGAHAAPSSEGGERIADGFVRNPSKWVIFPQRAYEAHGEINQRLAAMASVFSNEHPFSQFNRSFSIDSVEAEPRTREEAIERARASRHARLTSQPSGPAFGIMAGGVSAAYAREALATIADRAARAGVAMPTYRFMQVGTPFPFPEEAVAAFARGLSDILVLEELDCVLEDEMLRFAGRYHAQFNVHGRLSGETRSRGENDVDDITARVERFLGLTGRLSLFRARAEAAANAPEGRRAAVNTTGEIPGLEPGSSTIRLGPVAEASLPSRPPVLCAGCPHRGTFHAVKQALGETPAVLCGDIGCYTLGNAAPLNAVDTCLCMGAGITMAQGIAVADPGKKAIAYVGDSTFFASGMTGLANAAYNGHDITVIVLDNATTAMTGAQPHPGTGVTLMGERHDPLDIEAVLVANGISRVFHANPFEADSATVAVRAAVSYEGPSAVVFEGACTKLVPPGLPAEVSPDACTGCKKCIATIGCPAITFDANAGGPRSGERGQAVIDASLCVGCNLCVQVCPFKAIRPGDYSAAPQISQEFFATDLTTQMAPIDGGGATVLATEEMLASGEIPLVAAPAANTFASGPIPSPTEAEVTAMMPAVKEARDAASGAGASGASGAVGANGAGAGAGAWTSGAAGAAGAGAGAAVAAGASEAVGAGVAEASPSRAEARAGASEALAAAEAMNAAGSVAAASSAAGAQAAGSASGQAAAAWSSGAIDAGEAQATQAAPSAYAAEEQFASGEVPELDLEYDSEPEGEFDDGFEPVPDTGSWADPRPWGEPAPDSDSDPGESASFGIIDDFADFEEADHD